MKNRVGWVANGFEIASKQTFAEFIRRYPQAYPMIHGDEVRWMVVGYDDPSMDCWTVFVPEGPEDVDSILLESMKLAEAGLL